MQQQEWSVGGRRVPAQGRRGDGAAQEVSGGGGGGAGGGGAVDKGPTPAPQLCLLALICLLFVNKLFFCLLYPPVVILEFSNWFNVYINCGYSTIDTSVHKFYFQSIFFNLTTMTLKQLFILLVSLLLIRLIVNKCI